MLIFGQEKGSYETALTWKLIIIIITSRNSNIIMIILSAAWKLRRTEVSGSTEKRPGEAKGRKELDLKMLTLLPGWRWLLMSSMTIIITIIVMMTMMILVVTLVGLGREGLALWPAPPAAGPGKPESIWILDIRYQISIIRYWHNISRPRQTCRYSNIQIISQYFHARKTSKSLLEFFVKIWREKTIKTKKRRNIQYSISFLIACCNINGLSKEWIFSSWIIVFSS